MPTAMKTLLNVDDDADEYMVINAVADSTSKEAREREFQVQFIFRKDSDQYNGQVIELRLEERIGSTSHFSEYKKESFTLRTSFTRDFDF